MWICLNNAFLSIVEDLDNSNRLLIRARRREHIVNVFGNVEIIVNGGTDYKYRTFQDRKLVIRTISSLIDNINYRNFKNSVTDDDLHDLYTGFWVDHRSLQETEPRIRQGIKF